MRVAPVLVAVLSSGCPSVEKPRDAGPSAPEAREVRYETLDDESHHGNLTCNGSIERTPRGCLIERSGRVVDGEKETIGDYSCMLPCGQRFQICDGWFFCACVDAGIPHPYGPDDAGHIYVREPPCES
jgi:hypothetical protein